jgi:HlyD family secretion protein
MRIAAVLFVALTALPVWSQEPVVAKATIWLDTVKRGEMLRQVRGPGEITERRSVALRIAETQVKEIQAGQEVSIDTGQKPMLAGKVTQVGSSASNGVVPVHVGLNAPLPQGLEPGLNVDGIILTGRLPNVTYVGRPVGTANSEASLFRIDSDGMHATSVKVRFGRLSVNTVEVVEGLQPGDRVILSDMGQYAGQSRIRLQ